MTLLSIFFHKVRETGGVGNFPARAEPSDTSSGYTWFPVLSKVLKKTESSNYRIGDPEAGIDVTKDRQGVVAAWERFMQSAKLDRCVDKVKRAGTADNAYAVCHSSLDEAIGKLMGNGLKPVKKMEADSSTAMPQMIKAGIKKEASVRFRAVQLKEAKQAAGNSDSGHKKFRVVLIREGMGNFGDAFYYNRDALDSAVGLFAGSKIYADHPSSTEEETRPERSVRDVLGHYENLAVQIAEDGCGELAADVDVLATETWAIARMQRAIENAEKFPDKDFVGLSINASGDATDVPIDEVISQAPEGAKAKLLEAKANGIDSVRVVSALKSAVSCDLVTEAGAGGKIINLIEGSGENA